MNNFATAISPMQRTLIIIAVMIATLMQVLDTTIVNVALPHMQGSLSTTPDQITWTLTSYLVAAAVFMPLTGYFTDRLGRRTFLLISITGFTVISILCGASNSLTEIVIFRLLQGVFGAGLVPLSQAIMNDVFPAEERGKAMAIWGMAVMVGPILGPTLGGYLTEIASWRWTFYVNVPFGIIAFLLAWHALPQSAKKIRGMDWLGLSFLSLGIAALQYLLDRGNQNDWFNATEIKWAGLLTALGFIGFIFHSWRQRNKTVFDLRMFKDRNFTIANFLITVLGIGMFGAMVIQPLMLETLFNYPVLTAGLMMAPRGISGLISMMIAAKLMKYIDSRILIIIGILCGATSMYVCTQYSLEVNEFWIIWPSILQGLGLSFIFVPLSTIALATLPTDTHVEAAGLFSLTRTIGSSMGISITITLFTRHAQIAWNQLSGFIQPYNLDVQQYLNHLNLSIHDPVGAAIIAKQLLQQAQMISFVDTYSFIMWSYLAMLPFVFLIKKTEKTVATLAME